MPIISRADPLAVYLPKPSKANGQIEGQTKALAKPSKAKNITEFGTAGAPLQVTSISERLVFVFELRATPMVNTRPLTAQKTKAFFAINI